MKNIALCLGIAALLVACARQDDMGGTETTQTETERGTTTNEIGATTPQVTSPETGPMGANQDQRITEAVRNAIALPGASQTDHQVRFNVRNGVVTLQGAVKSSAEKQEIESKAKAVAGVTRVDNQIQVSGEQGQQQPQQGQPQQPQQGQPQQGQPQTPPR